MNNKTANNKIPIKLVHSLRSETWISFVGHCPVNAELSEILELNFFDHHDANESKFKHFFVHARSHFIIDYYKK